MSDANERIKDRIDQVAGSAKDMGKKTVDAVSDAAQAANEKAKEAGQQLGQVMEKSGRAIQEQGQNVENDFNELLRGEISAVETYQQAIDKFNQPEQRPLANVLTRLRDEHGYAVATLRERVIVHGGTPSDGAGVWGAFANLVEGTAKLLGPQTAIAALKQGELFGKEQYEKAVNKTELTAESRHLLGDDLMPKCEQHVAVLERLLAQLEAENKAK